MIPAFHDYIGTKNHETRGPPVNHWLTFFYLFFAMKLYNYAKYIVQLCKRSFFFTTHWPLCFVIDSTHDVDGELTLTMRLSLGYCSWLFSLWTIPILRQHIFGLFSTHPPTMSAYIIVTDRSDLLLLCPNRTEQVN